MAWWEQDVRDRLAEGPVTAAELGRILHCYGPDAVTRIKGKLPLIVVGELPGTGRPKLYALVMQHRWSARHAGLVPMKERK